MPKHHEPLPLEKLIEYIQFQLNKYLDKRSLKVWHEFANFFSTAGYNPNNFDARKIAVDHIKNALLEAQQNNKVEDFVIKLANAIHSIESVNEKSSLKELLSNIMDETSKYLFQHGYFEQAKQATQYADTYFNKKMVKEFQEYINWKISSSSLTYHVNNGLSESLHEKINGQNNFEYKKNCAQWAEYIVQKCTEYYITVPHHSHNIADYYKDLLVEMSVILNQCVLDDRLVEIILNYQKQIINRFIHADRVPNVSQYHQCVIGFTQPEKDKKNKESIYKTLQDIFIASAVQNYNKFRTSSNSLMIVDGPIETKNAKEEAEELVAEAWPRLLASEKQMKTARHKRKMEIFGKTLKSELTNKILAAKVLGSRFLPLPQANIAAAGNVLAAVAEKVIPVPVAAQGVGTAINQAAQYIDQNNQANRFNNAAEISPQINQIDPLVDLIAYKVSYRYVQQIQQLSLESDAQTVREAAQCAATRIIEFILKGELRKQLKNSDSHQIIAKLLSESICLMQIYHGLVPLSKKSIECSVSLSGDRHEMEDLFSCPGLVVIVDRVPQYFYNMQYNMPATLDMIERYGFMVVSMDEVNSRFLSPLPKALIPTTPHPAIAYSLGFSQESYVKASEFALYQQTSYVASDVVQNCNPMQIPAMPPLMPTGYDDLKYAYNNFACSNKPDRAVRYIKALNQQYHRFHHAFLAHYSYWVQEAAKAGDAESLLFVGKCFLLGQNKYGIQKDVEKAKDYLISASKSGDAKVLEKAKQLLDGIKLRTGEEKKISFRAVSHLTLMGAGKKSEESLRPPTTINSSVTSIINPSKTFPVLAASTSEQVAAQTDDFDEMKRRKIRLT